MDDYSTDCAKAALKAGGILVKMADPAEYIGGSYNVGDFTEYVNLLSIEIIGAFDDC